ncbi:MAG: hypothetical protein Q6373_016605 [Candidatus Sigynarchaeota archaeon]
MSYQSYTASCMECGATITYSVAVKKCRKCSMELCKKCYAKHGGLCIWCLEAAADTPLWLIKIAKIFMALSPVFGFLVPAPVPIAFLLQSNVVNWLWGFVYSGVFLIVFSILLGSAKAAALKSIVVKASPPAAPKQERDETALLSPPTTVQTTMTTSRAEQPYNPQLGGVQMNAVPLHAASAQAQERSLVFDIAAASPDATTMIPPEAGSTATTTAVAAQAAVQGDNDTQEPPSAIDRALEAAEAKSDRQSDSPASPTDQPQDLSIQSLESQLLGEISGCEVQPPATAGAHPEETIASGTIAECHDDVQAPVEYQPIEKAPVEPVPVPPEGIMPATEPAISPDVGPSDRAEPALTTPPVEPAFASEPAATPVVDVSGVSPLHGDVAPAVESARASEPAATTSGAQNESPVQGAIAPAVQTAPAGEPVVAQVDRRSEIPGPGASIPGQGESEFPVDAPRADEIRVEPTPEPEPRPLPSKDQGDDKPFPRKCPNCGRGYTADDVFCPDCGFALKT